MQNLIDYIAREFEMKDFVAECKKLKKIDNDEFVKLAKKKLSYDEFNLFKQHDKDIESYWFARQRELIKFTLDFVKSINN